MVRNGTKFEAAAKQPQPAVVGGSSPKPSFASLLSATDPPEAKVGSAEWLQQTRKSNPPATHTLDPEVNSVITIHVLDEARKVRKDFRCPRRVLIREMRSVRHLLPSFLHPHGHVPKYVRLIMVHCHVMSRVGIAGSSAHPTTAALIGCATAFASRYFETCLSDVAKIEAIDISVHCDVKIFDWLMKYVKAKVDSASRTPQDPSPERTALTVKTVVSILVSSEFLKMDSLVEECLVFCRGNINAIVKTPSNIACVTKKLLSRLAAQFTMAELRAIVDDADKVKSTIFWSRLELLFKDDGGGQQV